MFSQILDVYLLYETFVKKTFLTKILCIVCHLSSEAAEDENKNFKNEDWKADSEIREVGADMVNKYSMFISFGSCLRKLLYAKIAETCKCDNQLEMINWKFTLKMGKVFQIFLIGQLLRFNWK